MKDFEWRWNDEMPMKLSKLKIFEKILSHSVSLDYFWILRIEKSLKINNLLIESIHVFGQCAQNHADHDFPTHNKNKEKWESPSSY